MLAAITISLDSHWVEMYKVKRAVPSRSLTESTCSLGQSPGHSSEKRRPIHWCFSQCTGKRMLCIVGALIASWKARLVSRLTNLLNLQVLWPSKTAQTLLFGISMHFVKWSWWRARTMSSPFFWVIEHVFTVYEHLYLPIFTDLGQTWHFKTAFGHWTACSEYFHWYFPIFEHQHYCT
jgi:hypothetical protein